jgi:hypothetical protein
MTEREAIDTTLRTLEAKRAFLEALDLRHASLNVSGGDEEEINDMHASEMAEVVIQIREMFMPTLKYMWKENSVREDADNIFAPVDGNEPDTVMEFEDEHFRKTPKTPRNLSMSPVQCTSYFISNKCVNDVDSDGTILPTPPKRRRKWFFADNRSSDQSTTSTLSVPKNPFAVKDKTHPELRFEFGGNSSAGFSSNLHSFGAQVLSLRLDGFNFEPTERMYMPPTMSPIRKISVEAIE